jgi:Tol biopolymer transport system component
VVSGRQPVRLRGWVAWSDEFHREWASHRRPAQRSVSARDRLWTLVRSRLVARRGSRLAFVDQGWIGLINADGTGRQWVQTGTAGRDSSPTWSPDGTSLAFASEIWGRSAVYIVALADHYAKRVVPSKLLVANASSPAWSPREDRLAYSVGCGIRLITGSGRDVTPPSAGGCRHIGIPGIPSWSPDGRRIAVVNGGGTFVMDADGSHLSRVTLTTPRLMTPGWPARRLYAPASWQPLH